MFDPHTLTILSLGFVLGLRHALDADHLAALSTVLAERPTIQASTSIGFFWGLGHTLMLLCVGTLLLALNLTIPESMANLFEFAVGGMLVALGSLRPLLIGMAHGLAGSAALMLVVLSTVTGIAQGIGYIVVFGIGSILGMVGVGAVLSLPVVYSVTVGPRAYRLVQGLACVASLGLGVLMMVRIGLGGGWS
ncbi:MAG: hypothetical protein DYH03_20605 [Nitrospira sp. NTP1]|nr:hypothetical protein [Nitrospira sp. NTP1]